MHLSSRLLDTKYLLLERGAFFLAGPEYINEI